jgi:hypothetical protein
MNVNHYNPTHACKMVPNKIHSNILLGSEFFEVSASNFFSSDFFKHALIDSGLVVCIFYGTGEGKATKKPQFII